MIDLESVRSGVTHKYAKLLKRAFAIFCLICVSLVCARRLHDSFIIKNASPFRSSPSEPQEATFLSPKDLLSRPLATDLITVPKIFHQNWSSTRLPSKFEKWSLSCRRAQPDRAWVLWTDEGSLALMHKYAPWLNDTYAILSSKMPDYQADLARNIYMHIFGG